MILSGQTIRALGIIRPFCDKTILNGMSYGASAASYDVRIRQHVCLGPGEFMLASTVEHVTMPLDVAGTMMDKSTLARMGLSIFNTFIDPGFKGFITLELSNRGATVIEIPPGAPIGQIVFYRTDQACDGYNGKYQNQVDEVVEAILEPNS